jgi:hypothetical protein
MLAVLPKGVSFYPVGGESLRVQVNSDQTFAHSRKRKTENSIAAWTCLVSVHLRVALQLVRIGRDNLSCFAEAVLAHCTEARVSWVAGITPDNMDEFRAVVRQSQNHL